MKGIKSKIQLNKQIYSKKERLIGSYIEENLKKVSEISIEELAKKLEVSNATIIRFCKKIGFSGFSELKTLIKKERTDQKNIDKNLAGEKIKSDYISLLDEAVKSIDFDVIKKVADEILKSKKISIYGMGSSGLSAMELNQKLFRTGFNSNYFLDSHNMKINSSLLGEKDVIVVISFSGQRKEINTALEIAKSNGVKILGITNYKNSETSKLSDLCIEVPSKKIVTSHEVISIQVVQFFIIDFIFSEIFSRDPQKYRDIKERTIEAVEYKV